MKKVSVWFMVVVTMVMLSLMVLVLQQNSQYKFENDNLRTTISEKDGRIFELRERIEAGI